VGLALALRPTEPCRGDLDWSESPARFSSHYAITAEELTWLEGRGSELQARVERTCKAYLEMIQPKG